MLSCFNITAGKAHDHDKLAVNIEITAYKGSDFIFALLPPQPLFPMIYAICSILEGVCKYLLVDLFEVLNLGLFLYVKYHLFILENSDGEVV
jgi:hypothetical protein